MTLTIITTIFVTHLIVLVQALFISLCICGVCERLFHKVCLCKVEQDLLWQAKLDEYVTVYNANPWKYVEDWEVF